MSRIFNDKQKKILYVIANGKCQKCGDELGRTWEADHIIPYSKGGKTELSNGQALCRPCNRQKSNRMNEFQFREWQKEYFEQVNNSVDEGEKTFFCVAGVGAGKTFSTLAIADHLIKNKGFDTMVIISNSDNIKGEWAYTALESFDRNLETDYNFKFNWRTDFDGISITYQSCNELNTEVLKRRVDRGTILIVDEVHHAGDTKSWGSSISEIGELCGFVLLLSGTPTRSDNSKIPFVEYEKISDTEYELKSDLYYSYAKSVRDGVCCPVRFHIHKSRFSTFSGDQLELNKTLKEDDVRPYIRTLLDPANGDFLLDMFDRADKKLSELIEKRGEEYAGLVVCNTIEAAQNLYDTLTEKYGNDFCILVHSQDNESNAKINQFKIDTTPWIISVKQVSEGVNIPRIRVIVYASAITSQLFFTQVMGRGVRNPKHYTNDIDHCHFYLPEYAPLVDNAENIEKQIKHIIEEKLPKEHQGEYTYGGRAMSLEDCILESNAEYSGSLTSGFFYSIDHEDKIRRLAKENYMTEETFMRVYAAIMAMNADNLDRHEIAQSKITMTKSEQKHQIRSLITQRVGYIKNIHPTPIDYNDIHNKLNSMVGDVRTHAMTQDQLRLKLKYANEWISNIKAEQI